MKTQDDKNAYIKPKKQTAHMSMQKKRKRMQKYTKKTLKVHKSAKKKTK